MTTELRGLLFDAVRCSGCRQCVKACKEAHAFPGDPKTTTELSATAYTALITEDEVNVRKMCRHCVKPSCASVCPVGALEKSPLGPVTYDVSKCIGCRYCMVACPFNVPRYEWDKAVPSVRKCDGCIDRLREGKKPACADACRFEATVAGTRKELLQLAHERIAEDPDMYFDHVWGETELGGTTVLFLAPKQMDALGFPPSLGDDPLPDRTWQVLEKIPSLAVGGAALLSGFWWITRRRDEVMAHEARQCRARRQAARTPKGPESGEAKS